MPEFQRGTLVDNVKIANRLNELYHAGEEIRTPSRVNSALHKHKLSEGIKTKSQIHWFEVGDEIREGVYCAIDEKTFASDLSNRPDFRSGQRISNVKIADKLNELYHAGEEVRSASTVHAALRRQKDHN